jgi:signal transduction histidine kinase
MVALFAIARRARNQRVRMERLLQFTSHELKTPIAGVRALLQSLSLGLTPDRPDPSGTVNRVVQGVTIHPWNGAGGHVPRR